MKHVDDMLRDCRPLPTRELPQDFSARIVTELKERPWPAKRRWFERIDFMKMIQRPAFVAIALLMAAILGGATYATINNISLRDLMRTGTSTVRSDEEMQKIYSDYADARRRGDANARENFDTHITKELKTKLNGIKGIDPILCSQNIPDSITFEKNQDTMSVKAVHHYGTKSITVWLNYDKASGVYTDITCPAPANTTVRETMQDYYQDYVNAVVDGKISTGRAEFLVHTSKSLANKLSEPAGYDRILCAQGLPAMVTFDESDNNSIIAHLDFVSSRTDVELRYDSATKQFTDITCQLPSASN